MPDQTPLITTGGALTEFSSDERTMAALCHAVAALLGLALVGILLPLVVYLAYQDRSKYVTFHALQALVFQFVGAIIVWVATIATCGAGIVLAIPLIGIQLYYAWLAYQGSWKGYPIIENVGR